MEGVVMNWSGLVAMFTKGVNSVVRMQVLEGIATEGDPICFRNWTNGDEECLFLRSAMLARPDMTRRDFIMAGHYSLGIIGGVLGLKSRQVQEGFMLWDAGSDEDRAAFREKISNYIFKLRAKEMFDQAVIDAGVEEMPHLEEARELALV